MWHRHPVGGSFLGFKIATRLSQKQAKCKTLIQVFVVLDSLRVCVWPVSDVWDCKPSSFSLNFSRCSEWLQLELWGSLSEVMIVRTVGWVERVQTTSKSAEMAAVAAKNNKICLFQHKHSWVYWRCMKKVFAGICQPKVFGNFSVCCSCSCMCRLQQQQSFRKLLFKSLFWFTAEHHTVSRSAPLQFEQITDVKIKKTWTFLAERFQTSQRLICSRWSFESLW